MKIEVDNTVFILRLALIGPLLIGYMCTFDKRIVFYCAFAIVWSLVYIGLYLAAWFALLDVNSIVESTADARTDFITF